MCKKIKTNVRIGGYYRGFTLIELLAVIVILAIIALIATPIVLNIINETKERAQLRSAEFYLDAVEQAIMRENMSNGGTFKPSSCEVLDNGDLDCEGYDDPIEVEVSGEVPKEGSTITIENGKIKDVELLLSGKTITKNTEGNLVYGESEVQLQSGLYDEEGNLIASWDELVNDYGIKIDKDYEEEEYNELYENMPGYILSSNEDLNKGIKLVIDSSVTEIGYAALAYNTNLKEVIIPGSVISIGDWVFQDCTSLKEVIIPNSVTTMGEGSFADCTSLAKIVIPNSITSIEKYTFDGCTSLTEITIPNSIISIGKESFYNCTNLKTINYTGTQEEWKNISNGGSWDFGTPTDKVINYNYVVQ